MPAAINLTLGWRIGFAGAATGRTRDVALRIVAARTVEPNARRASPDVPPAGSRNARLMPASRRDHAAAAAAPPAAMRRREAVPAVAAAAAIRAATVVERRWLQRMPAAARPQARATGRVGVVAPLRLELRAPPFTRVEVSRERHVLDMQRHVELVWRNARAPGASEAVPIEVPPTQSLSAVTLRTAPPAAAAPVAARTAAPLESAVAERLVEDVLRKVERRVRIERERRGL